MSRFMNTKCSAIMRWHWILMWTKQLAVNETLNMRRQIDAINVAPPLSTALIPFRGPGLQNLVFFHHRKCCALSRLSSVQQPVTLLRGPDNIYLNAVRTTCVDERFQGRG